MQKSSSGKPAQSAGRPHAGVQHAVMTDDRASPGGHDDPGVKKLQACPRVVGRGPMGPPILGRAAELCVFQKVKLSKRARVARAQRQLSLATARWPAKSRPAVELLRCRKAPPAGLHKPAGRPQAGVQHAVMTDVRGVPQAAMTSPELRNSRPARELSVAAQWAHRSSAVQPSPACFRE